MRCCNIWCRQPNTTLTGRTSSPSYSRPGYTSNHMPYWLKLSGYACSSKTWPTRNSPKYVVWWICVFGVRGGHSLKLQHNCPETLMRHTNLKTKYSPISTLPWSIFGLTCVFVKSTGNVGAVLSAHGPTALRVDGNISIRFSR